VVVGGKRFQRIFKATIKEIIKMTTLSKLTPNLAYAHLASDEQIDRAAKALEAHGIRVLIATNGEEAKAELFEAIPADAEVFTGSSRTLDMLGIPAEVDKRYNSVRAKLAMMNRQTQMREMIKLGATPEYIIGSVHAVTEDGTVVIASNTGSQLAGYAAGAAHVVWVVGSQKIVPTLDEAMKRVREYSYPMEDERLLQAVGKSSNIRKVLIVSSEAMPGRTTMIIVKEELGF
jgi:L-lactate utilization protein LutC